jgi:hypothetical protein
VKFLGLRRLSLIVALACACASSSPVFADVSSEPVLEKPATLTPDALQLASHMGIDDNIKRIDELRHSAAANNLEMLQQKQTIMQAVMIGMLQVRAASAQINYDVFETNQVEVVLSDRRDRAIRTNSIANFVSGGISEMAGGAFQLVPNFQLDNAGNIIEMAGGAIQTGLSALALRQQQGGKRIVAPKPNMLAPIFDQSADETSRYPRLVWQYLNSPSTNTGATQSRRQMLVKQWLETGRLNTRDPVLIASITGNSARKYPVTIDILDTRMAMLADVNALVSRIDRLLLEILLYSDVQPAP